jgi:archaellin
MNGLIARLAGLMQGLIKQERGFTALQTAIGVVSSVAVAGTLGTAVVNSGSDAAEETQKVVQESIANIEGTYDLRGSVIGTTAKAGASGALGQLTFSLALVCSDGSMNFTPPSPSPDNNGLAGPDSQNIIVISYTDQNQYVDNLYWTVSKLGNDDGDFILDGREMYQITIGGNRAAGQNGGNLIDALNPDLSTYTKFSIDVKSPQGANLVLERTTPAYIHNIVNFRY